VLINNNEPAAAGLPCWLDLSPKAKALVLGSAVALVAFLFGLGLLLQRRPGCPRDPIDQRCIDVSTYSPHVLSAWLLMGPAIFIGSSCIAALFRMRSRNELTPRGWEPVL
jgi:hypothetical protein